MAGPPQPYVMFNGGHTAAAQYPPGRKTKSRWKRTCLWCTCCCCLFILIVVVAVPWYIYVVYKPRVPNYSVQNFAVEAFDVQPDFSLFAKFLVTVAADNPNSGIGFMYGENNAIEVEYSGSSLCTGKLPSFYQGRRNVSTIDVELSGKSEFGSGLQEALMDSRKSRKIPLLVKVRVPVEVVIGGIHLRPLTVFVNVTLVVDNLAPNKKIDILSSNTSFDVDF